MTDEFSEEEENNWKELDFDDLIEDIAKEKYNEDVSHYLVTKVSDSGIYHNFYVRTKDSKAIHIEKLIGSLEMLKLDIANGFLEELYYDEPPMEEE